MRHLIDTYIEACEPPRISSFESTGLLEYLRRAGDLAKRIDAGQRKTHRNKSTRHPKSFRTFDLYRPN